MNIKTLNHNLTKGVLGISFLFFMGCGSSNEQATQEVTETEPVQEEVAVVEEPEEEGEPFVEPEDPEMEEAVTQIAPPRDKGPVLSMMSTSYADWNADGNNVLDRNEFFGGIMQVWDQDDDGSINKEEFQTGTNEFFASYNYKKYGRFADWDTDGNGSINDSELEKGMMATVTSDKAAEAFVTIWDTDNDDKIERVEMGDITVRLDKDNN